MARACWHCARRAAGGDRTPVLVLSARARTDERIAGLDAGADDYLGKPFDLGSSMANGAWRRKPARRPKTMPIFSPMNGATRWR